MPSRSRVPDRLVSRAGVALAIAGAIAFAVAYGVALFRENVNWDELALLARSAESLQSGRLVAGGRPGLAVLLLMPFARGCHNAVDAVCRARVLWALFVAGYLAGIGALIGRLRDPEARRPFLPVALGLALVVLVPTFERWGLQVRTDQPAAAFALWGAVALLASERRPWLAAVAGASFAVGFLFTQKAVYLVALALLLAAGQAFVRRTFAARRALVRLALCALAAALVVEGFRFLIEHMFVIAPRSIERGLGDMRFYSRVVGFRVYRAMLPTLWAHIVLVALLGLATVLRRSDRRLPLAWAVLALGVAVAIFHGSRFPYFWITLAVFPAIAVGISATTFLTLFQRPIQHTIVAAAVGLLLVHGGPGAREVTLDTQDVQRASLQFVERNFPPTARGFSCETVLSCRNDPRPFPTLFTVGIQKRFFGPDGPRETEAMMREFRRRPVQFLIVSHRLGQFPTALQRFWNDAYVPYYRAVAIAGRDVSGPAGDRLRFEVVVAGSYRLHLLAAEPAAGIAIAGRRLAAGDTVDLVPGVYTIDLTGAIGDGLLALSLPAPPQARGELFFSRNAVLEIGGYRHW